MGGDWLELLWELLDSPIDDVPRHSKDADAKTAGKVTRMAKAGSWRRALGAVMAVGERPGNTAETWRKLLAELPSLSRLPPLTDEVLPLDSDDLEKLRRLVRSKLHAADPSAAQGVLGSSAGLWKPLLAQPIDAEAAVDVLVRIACGAVPSSIKPVLMYGDLMALPRPDERVRPIVVPSFLGKTALSALVALLFATGKSSSRPDAIWGGLTRWSDSCLPNLEGTHQEAHWPCSP